jgi:4-hydroxy-3-methylbut-2-enyl diphosphate reductase
LLSQFIRKEKSSQEFFEIFRGRYSDGFDPLKNLERIGVVNQTTMLASETQQIADFLKQAIRQTSQTENENLNNRFADTRDTLCYATNDNQSAVTGMLSTPADFAIVVGGYNSSNTSHLVELCELSLPTYFIEGPDKLISKEEILHFDLHTHDERIKTGWLNDKDPLRILITSGASCPDAVVESVINKIATLVGVSNSVGEYVKVFLNSQNPYISHPSNIHHTN